MISPESTLEEILDHVWGMLLRGGADGKHPYHFPSFATFHHQNGVEQRTVVLRKANRELRQLICYSDSRTQKVAAIQASREAHWLFYDHSSKEQIRAKVLTEIHQQDEKSGERWETIPPKSRGDYLGPNPPGTSTDQYTDNLPEDFKEQPTRENTEVGYGNFALIVSTVYQLDFLKLSREGHLRAQFSWSENSWEGSWVAP
ncbi:MAG: hypothetical protein AAF944_10955 [Bacteroidota bacterium]